MVKSIKLTNYMRTEILENVGKKYNENTPAPNEGLTLSDIDSITAHDLYYISPIPEKTKGVDTEYLTYSGFIRVEVGGQMKSFSYGDLGSKPCKSQGGYTAVMSIPADHEIIERHDRYVGEYADWINKKTAMMSQVEAILKQVSTTKQLVETWPEIEPMIPAYIVDPSTGIQLPAIVMGSLNSTIGL